MKTYLVGGAVRDQLLGLPVTERDWVVVGATPDEMQALGYRQVGRDFPVYLHPESHEEYALARTERKTGSGYTGFACNSDPSVTLEEDLSRRDLTINAIARDDDETLVDPYGGLADLEARRLRHVSPAFVEDPLRVLRVARFAARFAALGFTIYPETLALMQEISTSGELETLPTERIWAEFERALAYPAPQQFLQTLSDCKAWPVLLPELEQAAQTIAVLELMAKRSESPEIRFAGIFTGLSSAAAEQLCQRLKPPRRFSDLALLCSQHFDSVGDASSLELGQLLELLQHSDALRRPERFEQFLETCLALDPSLGPEVKFLRRAVATCEAVDNRQWADAGLAGHEIGERIRSERIQRLADLKASSNKTP